MHHMLRTILALALASSAWAETICSLEPTICNGTYTGPIVQFFNRGLTGTIPSQIGMLTQLSAVYLVGNDLTGGVPSQIGQLTAVQTMFLYDNNDLGGSLPSQLGQLTALERLLWGNSSLTGTIPTQFGLLTKLIELKLNNNDLGGSVPSQLGLLTGLSSYLLLNDNDLSGTLPSQLGNLKPYWGCDFGGTNSIDCPLPALSDTCSANLKCVPNKWCRKLKRLKQAKKHVKKREGNEGKWEVKCSQEK